MSEEEKKYSKNAEDDPDYALKQALGKYSEVLIIGWDKEGLLEVRGNRMKEVDALWLIEQFKIKLLSRFRGDYSD